MRTNAELSRIAVRLLGEHWPGSLDGMTIRVVSLFRVQVFLDWQPDSTVDEITVIISIPERVLWAAERGDSGEQAAAVDAIRALFARAHHQLTHANPISDPIKKR